MDGPATLENHDYIQAIQQLRIESIRRVRALADWILRTCNEIDAQLGNRGRMYRSVAFRLAQRSLSAMDREEFIDCVGQLRRAERDGRLCGGSAGGYLLRAIEAKTGALRKCG